MITREFSDAVRSLADTGEIDAEYGASLSKYCSFRIGGPAELAVWPHSEKSLINLISAAASPSQRFIVIGCGSNVLFDDGGYDGAVIFTTKLRDITVNGNTVTAGCGASLSSVAVAAQKSGLAGMEFAYGIPGSVGGAVYMNAGAYGGEIKDVLVSSRYYDKADGKIKILSADEHMFGYRHSSYMDGDNIILSAEFRLPSGDYADIQAKMDENMTARKTKQPLEYPSAGSAFKRAPGHYTAAMIDEAGLKGYSVGGAQVSEKHAGFIINRGGATSDDVKKLIAVIQSAVKEKFDVDIEPEIRFIGK